MYAGTALQADASATRYFIGLATYVGTVHEVFLSAALSRAYVVEVPGAEGSQPVILGTFVEDEAAAVEALRAHAGVRR